MNMDHIVEMNRDHLRNVLTYMYKGYLENLSNFNSLQFEDEITKENFKRISRFDYKKMIDWVLEMNR